MENPGIKLALLGGGNMARAIIGGLMKSGWRAADIRAADPSAAVRDALTKDFAVDCVADNAACARHAEVVMLAVKPQVMRAAVTSVAAVLQQGAPLVLSIAAGVRCREVENWGGAPLAMVRAMPNTPALVNAGMCGLFANERVAAAQRALAQRLMAAVGETVWVKREADMDTVTAISGSGPAYYFKLMELMVESAVEHGLDQDTATALVVGTASGAAALARSSPHPPATLRRQVTSRGGTTAAALESMAAMGLDKAVRGGIAAARQRAVQLAEEAGRG